MSNKTVLITGAGSGLGKSLAQVFGSNNYNLILSDINKSNLAIVGYEVNKKVQRNFVYGDLNDKRVINQLYSVSKKQGLDVLINNAGIYSNETLESISEKNIEKIINTNLLAPIKLTKKIWPLLVNKGSVININSIDSIYPKANVTSYTASKAGLRGFTESLKFEGKNDGIRVIGVYLGGMQTPMNMSRGVDISKAMDSKEVAQIIFDNSKRYLSSGIDEIVINRQNY